jgi:small subunit ribosomal protein S16
MVVVIRMKRTGRKHRPTFRISVTDSRSPRDGRTIETIGYYEPASPKPELRLKIDLERARGWVKNGAQVSDTVHSILRRAGVTKEAPPKAPRRRPKRKLATRARARRDAREKAFESAKAERRQAHRSASRAAKKAKKAAGGDKPK